MAKLRYGWRAWLLWVGSGGVILLLLVSLSEHVGPTIALLSLCFLLIASVATLGCARYALTLLWVSIYAAFAVMVTLLSVIDSLKSATYAARLIEGLPALLSQLTAAVVPLLGLAIRPQPEGHSVKS
jgi:hypothetical protein